MESCFHVEKRKRSVVFEIVLEFSNRLSFFFHIGKRRRSENLHANLAAQTFFPSPLVCGFLASVGSFINGIAYVLCLESLSCLHPLQTDPFPSSDDFLMGTRSEGSGRGGEKTD